MPDSTKDSTRYPLLAATAYLLVPGERRKRASGHFRKAGFEALKGINALTKPVRPEGGTPEAEPRRRQSISID